MELKVNIVGDDIRIAISDEVCELADEKVAADQRRNHMDLDHRQWKGGNL